MANPSDEAAIAARYRAYCDACQSRRLDQIPSYWTFPVQYAVDNGVSVT